MNQILYNNYNTIKRNNENPKYGRQRISRPMRIAGPILFWVGCVIYLLKKIKIKINRGCMIFLNKKK